MGGGASGLERPFKSLSMPQCSIFTLTIRACCIDPDHAMSRMPRYLPVAMTRPNREFRRGRMFRWMTLLGEMSKIGG